MEPPRPSAYTPFARRFGSEKEREVQETQALYEWVKYHQDRFGETVETIGKRVYRQYRSLPDAVDWPLLNAMCWLIEEEEYLKPVPPPAFDRMNLREFVEYRNLLHLKQYFFTNQGPLMALLEENLLHIFGGLANLIPAAEDRSAFTIPLAYALPDPKNTIQLLMGNFAKPELNDRGIFKKTNEALYRNLCEASGKQPGEESSKPWRHAKDSPLPLDQVVEQYLKGTVFHRLFEAPVPLKLTQEDRFSHMHIVGGSGSGKTSLLEKLIVHDLQSPDPPTVILIDPHSDLINKLIRADLGIEDRLVYVNPRDTKNPPALNVFAINQERLKSYGETMREQVTAGVIETFDFLFSGLFEMDLTGKQSVFFRYLTRLMLSLPDTMGRNATILDMLDLLTDATPYMAAIEALPPIQRDFFKQDVLNKNNSTFKQTKEQIRYRLQAIIESPTLARLLTAPETKIDLFTEMNRGAVIVVDTADDFLKSGSGVFGQIFIALILQAVQERAAIPAAKRKPTFMYIDEAHSYFSQNIDDLLTDARKQKCGLVLSHQFMDQASFKLRASLATNTGIKMASRLSANDARWMAAEMRTTADFILDQPKLQFAAYIRDVTPNAVSIPVEWGTIDRLPKLSFDAYNTLIDRNRARVSHGASLPPPAAGNTSSSSSWLTYPGAPPVDDDDKPLRGW